jgi:GNAT superfamily N-acetyltransferase
MNCFPRQRIIMSKFELTIERLTPARAHQLQDQLILLIQNTVNNGASIGFLRPMSVETATAYWQTVLNALEHGNKILLAALIDNQVVGSVQAELCPKQNGMHRAEVQKLMTLTTHRQHGIARKLMNGIEQTARTANRSTLFLDTVTGKPAEIVYSRLGWQRSGCIPNYAVSPDGEMESTTIFYKLL